MGRGGKRPGRAHMLSHDQGATAPDGKPEGAMEATRGLEVNARTSRSAHQTTPNSAGPPGKFHRSSEPTSSVQPQRPQQQAVVGNCQVVHTDFNMSHVHMRRERSVPCSPMKANSSADSGATSSTDTRNVMRASVGGSGRSSAATVTWSRQNREQQQKESVCGVGGCVRGGGGG